MMSKWRGETPPLEKCFSIWGDLDVKFCDLWQKFELIKVDVRELLLFSDILAVDTSPMVQPRDRHRESRKHGVIKMGT